MFHISNIGIKNELTKQTVKILMRRLIRSRLIWIYTVRKCVSEFTCCPNLPDFSLPLTLNAIRDANKQRMAHSFLLEFQFTLC